MSAREVTIVAALGGLLLPPTARSNQASANVVFRSRVAEVGLSEEGQRALAEKIQKLISFCGYSFFPPTDKEAGARVRLWSQIHSGMHLHAVFREPFASTADSGPTHMVSEVLIDLRGFPVAMSRHEGNVVCYGKCSGKETLRILCDKSIREYLTARQEEDCKVLDSWER